MRTLFFILILVPFMVTAQENFEFTKIIQVDSSSKKENFNKSKLWIANAFRSAKDVIQYENQEEGTILGKGMIEIKPTGQGMNGTIHASQAGNVRFSIELGIKEDRCRIRIYDMYHEATSSGGSITNIKPDCGTFKMTIKTWMSIQEQAKKSAGEIISEYETAIKSKTKEW